MSLPEVTKMEPMGDLRRINLKLQIGIASGSKVTNAVANGELR